MSLNLALVISGEASGAKAAADQTATAIHTVGVEAAQTSAAMVAANDQTVASAQRVTAALVGQTAAQQQLQAGVERMISAGSPTDDATYRQRAADIEAYGNNLDALRAKYNPLFAVEQEHLSRLQGIDQALKLGAISEVEHANAVAMSTAVYQRQVAGLGSVGNAAKLTANQLLNLSRQGNDAITMFLMGAPAMQIFASQGGQIYGALQEGPGGVAGSLKAVGEGVLGLVTKFPLATAAAGVAAVAIAAYAVAGGSDIKTLDDILKGHAENIKALGDAYDQVSGKQKIYASLTGRSVAALNERDLKDATDLLAVQISSIFDDVYKQVGAGGGNQGPLERVLRSQFEPFKQALDELARTSDVKKFIDEIDRIAEVNPALSSARDSLKALASEAADTAAKLPALAQPISGLVDLVDQFNRQIADVTSEPIKKALQDIFDKASEGKEPIEAINLELGRLEQANPTFSGIIAGFAGLIQAASESDAALDALGQKYFANQGGSPNGRGSPDVFLPDTAPTPDQRPNGEDIGAARDKRLARAARAANPYRDILKSAQDRIDQMKVELQLTGQVGVAADTLRNYQELLGRATDHGRAIGEKQKAELKDRAAQMAELSEATAAAKLQQDLLFERQQLFRSPTEQDVYERLRGANLDPNSAKGQAEASVIRVNDRLKESRALAGDFASTLLGGLRDGETVWQSFEDAGLQALDKITDKLLNDVLDAIYQINTTGSGGGGGILGAVGSLLGLGGGSSPAAAADIASGSWGLFDAGGWTGPGPRHKPAGVVHAGEVVWSQDDVSRAGGVGVVEAMRLGRRGYVSGGAVEGGMEMPATGTYGGGPTWSGSGSAPPREVVHRFIVEEGPMFRTTIRSESQDVSVQVVRANDAARADYYNAGGNPR
ncbi:hypothetical protein FJ937_16500 [Mesorhizobium sp. B2-4-4]|uniref:phage tail length tape measure family protein n=1 Tax=Mesorhizobium sp. B2-4-4 TaxID=2589945 RepID=UPI001127C80D|nr:phage tail length tape measure family protein [Mesorhizobium sp. B2-4-4]TPL49085.1 hypothetical protein FJ937_16500 [Mesorhizobium sp. B2-4-4]